MSSGRLVALFSWSAFSQPWSAVTNPSGAGQDLCDLGFGAVFDRGAHVGMGVGVKAWAESDRVAAEGPWAGAWVDEQLLAAELVELGGFLRRSEQGARCARQGRGSRLGGRSRWAAGHPLVAALGGILGFAVQWPAGSIRGATTPGLGSWPARPAPTREGPMVVFTPPPAGAPGYVRGRRAGRRRRAPAGAVRLRRCRCCGRGGRQRAPAALPWREVCHRCQS